MTELVRAAQRRPDIGVLSPVIYDHGSEDEIQFAGAVLDREREEHRTLRTLEALGTASKEGPVLVWGTALLLPRKTVDSVGVLDERYFAYHEDMDYCLRVMAAGLGTLMVPGAKVHHKRWRSLGQGQSPGREYLLVRNWYLFWRTYLVGPRRRSYPRRYLAWAFERAMSARRSGNVAAADHILDGAWDALRGHWGPLEAKGRMPAFLRIFLSKGLLAWHPYLWLMLLAGDAPAVAREALRRLGRSDAVMQLLVDGIIYGIQRFGGINTYFNEVLPRIARYDDTRVRLLLPRQCLGAYPGPPVLRIGRDILPPRTGLSSRLDHVLEPILESVKLRLWGLWANRKDGTVFHSSVLYIASDVHSAGRHGI